MDAAFLERDTFVCHLLHGHGGMMMGDEHDVQKDAVCAEKLHQQRQTIKETFSVSLHGAEIRHDCSILNVLRINEYFSTYWNSNEYIREPTF